MIGNILQFDLWNSEQAFQGRTSRSNYQLAWTITCNLRTFLVSAHTFTRNQARCYFLYKIAADDPAFNIFYEVKQKMGTIPAR